MILYLDCFLPSLFCLSFMPFKLCRAVCTRLVTTIQSLVRHLSPTNTHLTFPPLSLSVFNTVSIISLLLLSLYIIFFKFHLPVHLSFIIASFYIFCPLSLSLYSLSLLSLSLYSVPLLSIIKHYLLIVFEKKVLSSI